jgi:hypothetical protein
MHLALNPPLGQSPSGRLSPGATLGLNKSSTYPSTEQTLSALSVVINGGGVGQLGDIVRELNNAFNGREPQIRDLLTQLNDFIGVLAGGRCARLEAKQQSSDGRFPIAAVSEHQAESLARCEAMGGFAAVLALHPSGMYLVPWCNWRPVSKGARTLVSLDADALAVVGARFGDDAAAQRVLAGLGSPADWLRAAKERGWL